MLFHQATSRLRFDHLALLLVPALMVLISGCQSFSDAQRISKMDDLTAKLRAALLDKPDLPTVKTTFDEMLKLQPEWSTYRNNADLISLSGYKQELDGRPQFAKECYNLSQRYIKEGMAKYPTISDSEKARGFKIVGRNNGYLRNLPAMVEAFENSRKLNPDDWDMLNSYAFLLAEYKHRPDYAAEIMRRAYPLSTNNASVEDTLGWALHAAGKNAEAIDHLESALERLPTDDYGLVSYHLGSAYLAGGRYPEAVTALEKSIAKLEQAIDAHKRKGLPDAGAAIANVRKTQERLREMIAQAKRSPAN